MKNCLAFIGGSGLYDLDFLEDTKLIHMSSPWGEPSDKIIKGLVNGNEIFFLPRHGRGHRLSPTKINYQANIECLKQCGVTDIISLSAVGSLNESLKPGTFVIIDQFIDRTISRNKSFFNEGIIAHVPMAEPTSKVLMQLSKKILDNLNIKNVLGGTYLAMEGPQFSTKSESNMYRQLGCEVVGMTNMPEAKLAREAEIRYCSISMVTDYDCWHPDHENVDVQQVIKVLLGNAAKAKNMIKNLIDNFEKHIDPKDPTNNCLDVAIITAPEKRTQKTKDKLKTIAGRVLSK